jgi:hypothetical protein
VVVGDSPFAFCPFAFQPPKRLNLPPGDLGREAGESSADAKDSSVKLRCTPFDSKVISGGFPFMEDIALSL